MTLTLEEVQAVRFRIGRRAPGYHVQDVDKFVDAVEVTFAQHEQEVERLKRQIEALESSQDGSTAEYPDRSEEVARLQQEVEQLKNQLAEKDSQQVPDRSEEISRLDEENQQLRAEIAELKSQPVPAPAPEVVAGEPGAPQHLVVTTSEDASAAVTRLVQLATEQAEQVVGEANEEAKRKVDEAEQRANEITTDARTKADRIESEARVNAEHVTGEANARAADVDRQADQRRQELFDHLEQERDSLQEKVNQLRGFESQFRSTMREHLEKYLQRVNNENSEPEDVPELAQSSESETPRLEALMDEHAE